MACPPSGPRDADVLAMTCLERAKAFYNAYTALLTGKRAVDITYDNYTVRYRATAQGDLKMLADLYQQERNSCPEAGTLPSLNPANRARRGPPAYGTFSR